jgi:hypothetical protein
MAGGINFYDKLTPQERKQFKKKAQIYWDSLTHDQKVADMNLFYEMIRRKLLEHRGLYSVKDCIREFLNVDLPQSIEAAAQEQEQAGNLDVARDI